MHEGLLCYELKQKRGSGPDECFDRVAAIVLTHDKPRRVLFENDP